MRFLVSVVFFVVIFSAASASAQVFDIVEQRKLIKVSATNSASYGATSISQGEDCWVYAGGRVDLLEGFPWEDHVRVRYQPAMVFLDGGEMVNVWAKFRREDLDLCPSGTEFNVESRLVDAWEQRRKMTVAIKSSRTGRVVSRVMEQRREAALVRLPETYCATMPQASFCQ
ncbi:hypothetical protein [Geoalkalibacter subterraneus]|uniref:Uncharacterized protein n=1 Tax=Geoalkalibacter subterraneus TaxID=483547 RepID=A0A0B5FVZ9_9BACT|nr:hypothetical protein [Geoalkalibacter subterraneus]AJF08310.1 hypothetical protein GSUB_17720 [Geoalkalibacter subterraneus]